MSARWISIRLNNEEIDFMDECRKKLSEKVGFTISRNAFVRNLIMSNLDAVGDDGRYIKEAPVGA